MKRMIQIMRIIICAFSLFACTRYRGLTPEERGFREEKIRALLREGTVALREGKVSSFDRAEAAFSVARQMSPEDPRVLDGLGCVAWRKGNDTLAEFYFRRAIELDRSYDRPIAHLALVASRRGHLSAARELLAKAVKLNPLSYRARNNYALAILNTKVRGLEEDDARRELLRAIEIAGEKEENLRANLWRHFHESVLTSSNEE